MRFYEIQITDTSGNVVQVGGVPMSFSSHNSAGGVNKGALNIEFDIPVVTYDIPAGNAFLKIWGVDLATLNQAALLNSKNITILAGMKEGLPLANEQVNQSPNRNGIIFQGSIFQAFGNWQGTEQSLDLIITTQLTPRPQEAPKKRNPIIFNCKKGQSFSDAIAASMQAAGISASVSTDGGVVATEPVIFQALGMSEFAQVLKVQSKRFSGASDYLGIQTCKTGDGYKFDDGTKQKNPISINFNDLIGQPTWLELLVVQLKTVMRSDIQVMDTVTMPKSNILNRAKLLGEVKEEIAFSGTALVKSVRHIGNFRQQDANSWVTVIDSILNTTAAAQ